MYELESQPFLHFFVFHIQSFKVMGQIIEKQFRGLADACSLVLLRQIHLIKGGVYLQDLHLKAFQWNGINMRVKMYQFVDLAKEKLQLAHQPKGLKDDRRRLLSFLFFLSGIKYKNIQIMKRCTVQDFFFCFLFLAASTCA